MKKFLITLLTLCSMGANLSAKIECDASCLQNGFENPGKQSYHDIYMDCCKAWVYQQPQYAHCNATCDNSYNSKNSNAETIYENCLAQCDQKYRKALMAPRLACN